MTSQRVWPTWVAMIAILPVYALFSGAIAALYAMAGGGDVGEMEVWLSESLATPEGFAVLLVPGQLLLALVAASLALASPTRFSRRLALVRPQLDFRSWLLIFVGGIGLQFGVSAASELLLPDPNDHMKAVTEMIVAPRGLFVMGMVAGMAFLPGFCEELFFRGYVQTGLQRRLSPLWFVLISAVSFAIMHMDVQHAVVAFPLGLWCALITWASGSVWPAVFAHTFNNLLGILGVWIFSDADVPAWMMVLLLGPAVSVHHLIGTGRRKVSRADVAFEGRV